MVARGVSIEDPDKKWRKLFLFTNANIELKPMIMIRMGMEG
jgi:hypothetical protein